jgi:hypothetical protein
VAADEPKPQSPREEAEQGRRQRLLTAISDMDEAALAARWLHATHTEVEEEPGFDDFRLRIVMETGMFVSYARPFTQSRGERNLPLAPTRGLTVEQRGVHEWALERRTKSAAHFDQDN